MPKKISTPALREEGDDGVVRGARDENRFQPPPSARRATAVSVLGINSDAISTPALREEGDFHRCAGRVPGISISTPALREEGDIYTRTNSI